MVSKTERGTPLRLPSQRGVRCMGELGKWESEMKGRVGKMVDGDWEGGRVR